MSVRCIALLSGGLDSMLAIRIMQRMGVEVEAVNFKTAFTCCQDSSAQAARDMGVRLTVLPQEDDYLDLVRHPRFGRGKGANPCVDCRVYMFQKAKRLMEQINASFIVSGEVVGQRPMSQKKRDLRLISHHSDLEDLLLRPLSAKILPPTLPEREGWVDREALYGFYGRGRKGLIQLAHEFGIESIPSPSTGCALTEPRFSKKVFDLLPTSDASSWDFELLKFGRHFRFDAGTKVIVGRNQEDNARLVYLSSLPDASAHVLVEPDGFHGPAVLVIGTAVTSDGTSGDETGSDETGSDETGSDETGSDETGSDETGGDETGSDETGSRAALEFATGLMLRYSNDEKASDAWVRLSPSQGEATRMKPCDAPAAREAKTIAG